MGKVVMFVFLIGCLFVACVEDGDRHEELSEERFRDPGMEFGPSCFWWWLNGNVTEASITRDLEAMNDKGFRGALIFDAGGAEQHGNGQVPAGPLFGSPEWRRLFRHAVSEAARLGLELSLNIQSGWNLGGPDVAPQEAAKLVTWASVRAQGGQTGVQLPVPEHRADYYGDIAVLAFPLRKEGEGLAPVSDLKAKGAFGEAAFSAHDMRYLLDDKLADDGRHHAAPGEVRNISEQVTPDGKVSWDIPPGEWEIIRFGYTNNGAHVSTASGDWQGLVVDYLSQAHFQRYWDTHVGPLLEEIGPEAGKTLRYLHTDSWELGGSNWTQGFETEFKNRRGYELIPYLPVLAGKIVGNREISNRFLADFRKTIGDCISDNHFATFAANAARYGMGIHPESAGPHAGPFDGLKNYGHSALVMSEFWSPSKHRPTPERRFFVKQASSAAHIYDRRLVGAEGFTTIGRHWNDVIWEHMKHSFDHEVCAGANRVYFHTFTSSPAEMGKPGQEYFAGTHMNPNITWWEEAGAFFRYLSRVHYMMQDGRFVADVLYYYGDHVPNIATLKASDPAGALPDFDYDVINEDRLLALEVRERQLMLPHGMRYRVLVLPDHAVLSTRALHKVAELVDDGATIIGPKTQKTVSLTGYPVSEDEVEAVAARLWGDATAGRGSRSVGKGTVAWGYTARKWLLEQGVPADCRIAPPHDSLTFDYIHHVRNGASSYYFISSQNKVACDAEATFRIAGKLPELWNPVTGEVKPARTYRQAGGLTTVPLHFDPMGSWFVVFRKDIPESQQGEASRNLPAFVPMDTLSGSWKVYFDEEWGAPAEVEFSELSDWAQHPDPGVRFYSGKGRYVKTLPPLDTADAPLWIDLGQIADVGIARVRLNGRELGIVWAPPYRIALHGLAAAGNTLEVEVVNSWRNRLVGDRGLPADERFTQTNITIRNDWELLTSGLLGPVVIGQMIDD
ncbi:glycosyl hydrolase [Parapedobacter deserti]|uniref:Glycosyl hydrolase n=1 Tax=Parapedobacter deserti TaxID=1912957 RepID=A0ABV7JLD2_9SPHI